MKRKLNTKFRKYKMKRKKNINKAHEVRDGHMYKEGIKAAKKAINKHMVRRYWVKGFMCGIALIMIVDIIVLYFIR